MSLFIITAIFIGIVMAAMAVGAEPRTAGRVRNSPPAPERPGQAGAREAKGSGAGPARHIYK